jgi:ABC-2 type transport system ATP-binding protein
MLDFMKLESDRAVRSLSKGNRGRLKIVLAVSRRAPLILMDEPLSGLDPMAREMIIKGLISFVELEEQTVILTTHEVSEVEPLLDLVVAIQEGQVLKMDKVDQIRDVYGQSLVDWMKTTLI